MSIAANRSTRVRTGPTPESVTVEARVQFIVPTAIKPFSYEYEPPPGMPRRSATFHSQRIPIHDARQLVVPPSLDAQAFALRWHTTRVSDFYDTGEVKTVYYPEVERLIQDATGARSILIFDHTVRGDATASRSGTTIKEPVHRAHNDYTPRSGPRRVEDLLSRRTANRLLRHRVLEINVWRAIRGPLQTMPLAVCDATSLRPEDLVACDLLYRDRVGEISYIAHDERQRWYYYPDMQRDEVLLLKCFESDRAHGGVGAHAAFEHPHTPPDALPRESIEVRAFAFFAP